MNRYDIWKTNPPEMRSLCVCGHELDDHITHGPCTRRLNRGALCYCEEYDPADEYEDGPDPDEAYDMARERRFE